MELPASPIPAASNQQLTELTILYQFSNTMLSTIRLNKLTHLILTALTSDQTRLFERAMLFLRNEKSGVLQGMLAVVRNESFALQVVGTDPLTSHWDISDDVIASQRDAEVSQRVRAIRIEANEKCAIIDRVIRHHRLYDSGEAPCDTCDCCDISERLGLASFAVVPLVARDHSLGIVIVDNPLTSKSMSRDSLHFLQLIANQAGMAIENSMLYNRIENAHASLRDARESLTHGERLAAIGEMAANLAHELKNPLITIGGFAGRLLKKLPEDGKEHHYADTIVKEVGRLEKMLADILAFSRKPTICYNRCELDVILRECLESCAATLEDHAISVETDFDGGPWTVLGDAFQLKQVFLNLVLNASEVMEAGGDLSIAMRMSELDKNSVTVSIGDSGGGIPIDMLPRIFNPFFTTKRHGTGLGLAIVNRILLNHNGSIEAANNDKGAVFTVTLPLAGPQSE